MATKQYLYALVIALGASGLLAGAAQAQGFRGHHPRSSAGPCLMVANSAQRSQIKQLFDKNKQTLMGDRMAVMNERKALTQAILSGTTDLSKQEASLMSAEQKALQDRDAFAAKVCGVLTQKQLSAAANLYNELSTLRENFHKQVWTEIKNARTAAGD